MGADSKIEWCDHTFNPWWGCTKVSPGCDHCYAEALAKRYGHDVWGVGKERRAMSQKHWQEPFKWNERARQAGRIDRVFCASMADVFDNEAPAHFRTALWQVIASTPHLAWLLLTKRIGNVAKMLPEGWVNGWPNVWLGISVVNQEEADRDIPKLLTVPAAVRFLSCEPLLGAIDLTRISLLAKKPGSTRPGIHIDALRGRYCESGLRYAGQWDINGPAPPAGAAALKLDWVIAGGESGPGARPMHPAWARSLRDQCKAHGVAFFMKQMTKKAPIPDDLMIREFPA